MKIEHQVTSLELSKRLKELGVKQNGYFFWRNDYPNNTSKYENKWYLIPDNEWPYTISKRAVEYEAGLHLVSAFTTSELGEMLPKELVWSKPTDMNGWETSGKAPLELSYNLKSKKWIIQYILLKTVSADTEADARAKILIYLLENNLIT